MSGLSRLATRPRLTPLRCATVAAVSYACIPLTVELTGEANPFWYNMISQLSHIPVLVAALAVMARRWFPSNDMPLRAMLTSRDTYLAACHRGGRSAVATLRDWWRMPLVWLLVVFCDYTLYVWSTHFVDTAVTATMFELWPVLFMVLFMRLLLRTAGTQRTR